MLQVKMTEAFKMSFLDVPVPEIGDDEVLIRMKRVGVCGSDIQIYHGRHKYMQFPVVQGHEGAGVVARVGAKVASRIQGRRQGDRAAAGVLRRMRSLPQRPLQRVQEPPGSTACIPEACSRSTSPCHPRGAAPAGCDELRRRLAGRTDRRGHRRDPALRRYFGRQRRRSRAAIIAARAWAPADRRE